MKLENVAVSVEIFDFKETGQQIPKVVVRESNTGKFIGTFSVSK